MIGDDDIEREFGGAPHHFGGANARIHADNQRDALGRGGFDHFRPHAIAILQPVGNVGVHIAAGQPDGGGEKHHGHGAVHIVVAVDENFFVGTDGPFQTRGGFRHVAQRQRVVKLVKRGMEKAAGVVGRNQGTPHQHPGRGRRDAESGGQSPGRLRIGSRKQPASHLVTTTVGRPTLPAAGFQPALRSLNSLPHIGRRPILFHHLLVLGKVAAERFVGLFVVFIVGEARHNLVFEIQKILVPIGLHLENV
jgi:hypothetical protein